MGQRRLSGVGWEAVETAKVEGSVKAQRSGVPPGRPDSGNSSQAATQASLPEKKEAATHQPL